jgi:hypothetical protein
MRRSRRTTRDALVVGVAAHFVTCLVPVGAVTKCGRNTTTAEGKGALPAPLKRSRLRNARASATPSM